MRKSSFGQFNGRLSTGGPLRVKNDGGGPRRSATGSRTPQSKQYSSASSAMYSGSSLSKPRSSMFSQPPGLGNKRNSTLGGRSSGIGSSGSGIVVRSSGVGVRSRTDVPKDPRPTYDKAYQHRCIKVLIDFLTEMKYPHPLSQKLLMSPPSKEFFRIFEFIYGQIDPAFKIGRKAEEDVPRILKMLGYPFNISRSSMHAVGTPHTWPTLLAALIWLIDIVKFTQSLNEEQLDLLLFPPDNDEFDSVPDDKIKFQYSAQAFASYLQGADEFDELDEALGKVLEDKYLGQSGGIEAIRSENSRLAEEIELLEKEMSQVDKLQEQQEIMLLDEKKFQDYLMELTNVSRKHQLMLQKAKEEHTSLEQELQSEVAKNQHLQAIYEQQDLTPADVERLRAARQELQRQEEGLERLVEAIDSDIWKEEMGIAKVREKLDNSLEGYSKLVRALRLIPASAEQANGIDFELRSTDPNFCHKFDTIIMPAQAAMKKKGMETIVQMESDKLQEQRRLDECSELINELKEQIAQMEKDIARNEKELESRKQLYQRDLEGLQNTVDQLQEEIHTQRTSSQISLQDAERELRETHSWAEQKVVEFTKKEQEYGKFFLMACSMVADHKTHVQQQLKTLEQDMAQVLVQEQERTRRMEAMSRQLRQQFR